MNVDRDIVQVVKKALRYPLWLQRIYPYEHSITYRLWRWSFRMWRERFTRAGRFVATASVATAIAASFPELMTGGYMFWGFASLMIVSLAISAVSRPRVRVTRRIAPRCIAGSPVISRVTVTNIGKRALLDVGAFEFRLPRGLDLEDKVQYVSRLAPGESFEFAYKLTPQRRGVYQMPGATAVQAFPFGLTHAPVFHHQPQRLLVYPTFHPLKQLDLPAGRRYQPGGLQLVSKVGESMEYISNREYRPGDRVRDLHPRSWARVGVPVVKQYQEEFLTRIAVVVDTHLPKREMDDRLEATLSLAAAVSDYLARQEYIVDLFAAGPDLYHFEAGRSLGYLDDILDVLSCIERCPDDPFEVISPELANSLRATSTVVALFLSWDKTRQEFVQEMRRMGVQVKVIIVPRRERDIVPAEGDVQFLTLEQVEKGVESL